MDNDKIIGTSVISIVEKPPYFGCSSGKIGLLSSMFTDKIYRRKGIAKTLLSKVVDEARTQGCGTIQITASDIGVLLYTAFGFEKNGLWYEKQGDYYLPCLSLPEEKQNPIGIWGQRRLNYLKHHRNVLYYNLLTSGKLHSHLADTEEQAQQLFLRLVKELADKEGVTEQLKATDQMKWVRQVNNIRNRVTEIINAEIIYTS